MKKWLSILISMSLFIGGCNKAEPYIAEILVGKTEFSLFPGQKVSIGARSSLPIRYVVENDFHASVTPDGDLAANRVGSTKIILDNGEYTVTLNVVVHPQKSFYEEPVVKFGITRDELRELRGEPDAIGSFFYNTWDYWINEDPGMMAYYQFDAGGGMEGVIILMHYSDLDKVLDHLLERYTRVEPDRNYPENLARFINHLSFEKASVEITVSSNMLFTYILYQPYQPEANASSVTGGRNLEIIESGIRLLKSDL